MGCLRAPRVPRICYKIQICKTASTAFPSRACFALGWAHVQAALGGHPFILGARFPHLAPVNACLALPCREVFQLLLRQAPSSWMHCLPSTDASGNLLALASLGWHLFRCQRRYQGLLHAWAPATRCNPWHGGLQTNQRSGRYCAAQIFLRWRALCRAYWHVHVHCLPVASPHGALP